MINRHFLSTATLFAAGAFAGQADAATVNIVATTDPTGIDLVGDSTLEYEFTYDEAASVSTLTGKFLTSNVIGPKSDAPYYPTGSESSLESTRTLDGDGYYGLYFEDFDATGVFYSGYALVDEGGTRISEIEFRPVSAVPVPAAWTLMALGLGAAGAAVRRRQKGTSGLEA